ncbi:DNA-directed DNA polymerase [Arthrobacter crystallopoietes BAB-32]|uniref:DNA polymerase IV n=1 Tax=Arthrobacter crystallopoietes BAB-32 TaxID=1246476 RepID=N1V0J1_9MICC|nr:DNA polymerase IV [Arthrobacter crystallopoietes]EMY33607.1 DNA-directed DNA polymerase [Arthrobacter crystallopoietes BAB-32]
MGGSQQRERIIMHVDMDAFFVSVELLEQPALLGTPVIVGSPTGRSVVLSASYEARKFGVRSAMPMARARQLCPQAAVIPPHHGKYQDASSRIMEIFRTITPDVEQLSVDEAFLDITGAVRRLGQPLEIGRLIRRTIRREIGIPATVGIASSKFVAKIASTHAKPDGLLQIPAERTVQFLHTLPVDALWGVGAKTSAVLARQGIRTVAELASTPEPALKRLLGAVGEHVHRLAWGIDDRSVTPERVEKSIGAEETFAHDVDDTAVLERELLRLAHRTAVRLRSSGLQCRGVALKLRYADFTTLTRSRRLREPADSAHELHTAVVAQLSALGARPMAVRLIGLRAELLEPASGGYQLSFDGSEDSWRSAEAALDEVNRKYGAGGVLPASLLARPDRPESPAGPPGRP